MKENIVEIPAGSGNRYRYHYDEISGKTVYDGPVGQAPTMNEEEFLRLSQIEMENFQVAEAKIDAINEELRDVQVEMARTDGLATIKIKKGDKIIGRPIYRGSSIPVRSYADAMARGMNLYLDYGKERPIKFDPDKSTVEITSQGKKQPGGKGKGRTTKPSSQVRKALAKQGGRQLTIKQIAKDTGLEIEDAEAIVEDLIERGEIKLISL